jgi:hypothetical protein
VDSPRSRPDTATRCASVPTDDGRGSFNLEIIAGQRIALRYGRMPPLFLTHSEARRVLTALAALLGADVLPPVRL